MNRLPVIVALAALVALSVLAWPGSLRAESIGQILDEAEQAFGEDRLDRAEVALDQGRRPGPSEPVPEKGD